jgi:diguanylate cyclase (GGDEF)-like protein/PAS domain S-box-containing protein
VAEALIGLTYFLLASSSMLVAALAGAPLIWPANAVAVALMVRRQHLRWFWAVAFIAAGGLLANALFARVPPLNSAWLVATGLMEIGTTAWALRRWFRSAIPDMTLVQGIQIWLLFGLGIPMLFSIPGGAAIAAATGGGLWPSTQQWLATSFIGAALCAPTVYLYSRRKLRRLRSKPFGLGNLAFGVICLAITYLGVRYAAFPFELICVALTLTALRLGALGSAVLSCLCGVMAIALWTLGNTTSLPLLPLAAAILAPVAVGLATDDRRRAMRAMRRSEETFRESLEHSPIGVVITDLEGRWLMTNAVFQRLLGYSLDETQKLSSEQAVHPDDIDDIAQRLRMLKSGEMGTYTAERRYLHRKGHWIWTRVAVSLARDENGHPLHFIGYVESLEIRLRAERELADERERLKTTLRTLAESVITTDVEGRITYANSAAESLLNLSLAEISQRKLDEVAVLTDPDTSRTTAWMIALCMAHGEAVRRELPCVLHRTDGTVRFVAETVSPVLGTEGQVKGFALVLHDATEDYSRGRELNRRANYDQLTGLANRFEFDRRLNECLEHARCLDHPATLVMIDLDRFKEVNDQGGHAAGDAVLQAVARALLAIVRESDVVARPGGDEFAVILVRCSPARGLTLARKILDSLLAVEVSWGPERFQIGASIGVAALAPPIQSSADWVAAADAACYQAKRAGRGQMHVA